MKSFTLATSGKTFHLRHRSLPSIRAGVARRKLANAERGRKKLGRWRGATGKQQGFTIKVDSCARLIAGVQIKNKGTNEDGGLYQWSTKGFKVSVSNKTDGSWQVYRISVPIFALSICRSWLRIRWLTQHRKEKIFLAMPSVTKNIVPSIILSLW